MRSRTLLAAVAASALVLAACGDDDDNAATTTEAAETTAPAESADIVDTAIAAGSFETLTAALTEAGLVETLKGEGPFTVFAPTDEAFAAVPAETLDALLADQEALTAVLTYHVVSGAAVMAADVTTGPVASVEGSELDLVAEDGGVTVNGANVTTADVTASNGVIHVIDQVLVPPTVDLSALGGEESMDDKSMDEESMDEGAEGAAEMDIVDTAVAAGSFSTLATALTEAGLVETLKGEGPFTVFAPTDEAFAAVPADVLEKLLANQEALTRVLTYHVIPGAVPAADVTTGAVASVEGSDINLVAEDGMVMVNDANVITADVMASNGVIHVIDAVIIPPDLDLASL